MYWQSFVVGAAMGLVTGIVGDAFAVPMWLLFAMVIVSCAAISNGTVREVDDQ